MHKPLPLDALTAANVPFGQHVLHRDFETRSRAVLKTVGAQRYAADPSTEILCCCYAVDDDPVQLWRPGDPVPQEFIIAAQSQNWIVAAFNDAIEAAIEKSIMAVCYGWPVIPIERHRCIQAMCLALGLPARLSAAADALELEHRKDAAGERLMHQTSKPRRAHKDENPDNIYWFEDQERLDRLFAYCAQDVRVERELHNLLPSLSSSDQPIWQLRYQINIRGFHIDRNCAEAARKIAEAAAPEINQEIQEITAGDVATINQVAKLTAWLHDHGCGLQKLDRKAIERQLQKGNDELTV